MKAAILMNVGTPASPSVGDVRRYLAEFLMDPFVLDLPAPLRFALVHGVILRTRPRRSAHAYASIWTPQGSPLLVHLKGLAAAVQSRLGGEWRVLPAMGYGQPKLGGAFEGALQAGAREIVVIPLFPQFSEATTRSATEAAKTAFARSGGPGAGARLKWVGPFYARPEFTAAFSARVREAVRAHSPDYLLLSFHGLPERQVRRASAQCLADASCCETIGEVNRDCYRAQCYATARAIAASAGLQSGRWGVSFQSRMRGGRWIGPHTDAVLKELPGRGFARVAVACPAFVADCLETLEEIGIRGRAAFLEAGGRELTLVPSLNAGADWAQAVAGWLEAEGAAL